MARSADRPLTSPIQHIPVTEAGYPKENPYRSSHTTNLDNVTPSPRSPQTTNPTTRTGLAKMPADSRPVKHMTVTSKHKKGKGY